MVFNVLKWYLLFQNEKMVKLFTSQITDAHVKDSLQGQFNEIVFNIIKCRSFIQVKASEPRRCVFPLVCIVLD